MIDTLLVLNTGSSSLKFQIFEDQTLNVLMSGKVTGIGDTAEMCAKLPDGQETRTSLPADTNHDSALSAVVNLIGGHDHAWHIAAVVHRVVHGGQAFVEPVIVTPEVMRRLEALIPLAPLHQPHNLAGITASARLASGAPDIACFDTAFHAGHDKLTSSFALPRDMRDKGIRRYGFHGLSYEWISQVLSKDYPDLHAGRVVVGHLGNGASLCALRNGISVDTTMSMTALDGIPMGTRSGSIDPGAVLYMLQDLNLDVETVRDILYERSGLRGLSGISNDVETLLRSDDPQAAFALEYFALRTAQHAAMMAVSMGGIDAFVFTGGIGEHAGPVRESILGRLRVLGDFKTLVIPTNEERLMATHAKKLLCSAA
ncbi:acetate/propionate family kinase [Rhizobium sp. 3T7]|uniref:acetate/propionate family kinase n=1 Tax=Rhizobium sp. 3T7 TaxID=2874922 RepID=UPI001CCB66C0|nr:acetate/propionate family kinase [Rhizobium sp. 3T7]MBZ9788751.1 acetate/propionate family kinase [Rhizobium sp. 3T7]